jgi:hypothetical protein
MTTQSYLCQIGDIMQVGYPDTARPHIQHNHVDGPLLRMRDGRLHWPTLWERVLLFFGQTDAKTLEDYYWCRGQW